MAPLRARLAGNPIAHPIATPMKLIAAVRFRAFATTVACSAPMAMRIPISCDLAATRQATTAYKPTRASAKPIRANETAVPVITAPARTGSAWYRDGGVGGSAHADALSPQQHHAAQNQQCSSRTPQSHLLFERHLRQHRLQNETCRRRRHHEAKRLLLHERHE